MKSENRKIGIAAPVMALVLIILLGAVSLVYLYSRPAEAGYQKFSSCSSLDSAFRNAYQQAQYRGYGLLTEKSMLNAPAAAGTQSDQSAAPEYSGTNVQVAGVDEADIVKTDGNYIYTVTSYYNQENAGDYYTYGEQVRKLVIARAYPGEDAQVVSETDLGDFQPSEIFIEGGKLMIFGSNYTYLPMPLYSAGQATRGFAAPEIYPYYPSISYTVVQVWDVSDRSSPSKLREVDFEGSYLSSRKIGDNVYFVVNSYPRYYVMEQSNTSTEELIPKYRDSLVSENFTPACGCTDIGYLEPVNPENFVTVVSMSISNPDAAVNKEVIVGSGQNIYASTQNLYVAESSWPFWFGAAESGNSGEKTFVYKFAFEGQNARYIGNMEAPGRILNQFSMDEYNNYFRIATTVGQVSRTGGKSSNNVYIFGSDLNVTGKLEDLAPGEDLHSARFIGDRGYLVTFKKIDPFFVLDLSDPSNPKVLGSLKIPGYSDYLQPYDENHIIGIGKEAVDAELGDAPWIRTGEFAWYQGIKIAIFDVSDVSNPVQMHKVVIGDRGTDSEVLQDHKALLFDKDKNLLVLPILLAEIKGDKANLPDSTYGDYVFQGAYVYTVTLENGFELKGRITHYDSSEPFLKSGYYFDGQNSVKRSLFIDSILYTISPTKIKLNSLDTLEEIKTLSFGG